MEGAIRAGHAFDLVPLLVQRPPGKDSDARGWWPGAVVDHRGDLLGPHALAPVGELDDGPDLEPLARAPLDADVVAEPGDLARDPGGVARVAEARVVRHRAEHVEQGRLRLEVDGQLVPQGAVEVVAR